MKCKITVYQDSREFSVNKRLRNTLHHCLLSDWGVRVASTEKDLGSEGLLSSICTSAKTQANLRKLKKHLPFQLWCIHKQLWPTCPLFCCWRCSHFFCLLPLLHSDRAGLHGMLTAVAAGSLQCAVGLKSKTLMSCLVTHQKHLVWNREIGWDHQKF